MNPGDLYEVNRERAALYAYTITQGTLANNIEKILDQTDEFTVGYLHEGDVAVVTGEIAGGKGFDGGFFVRVVTRLGVGWVPVGVLRKMTR